MESQGALISLIVAEGHRILPPTLHCNVRGQQALYVLHVSQIHVSCVPGPVFGLPARMALESALRREARAQLFVLGRRMGKHFSSFALDVAVHGLQDEEETI